MWWQRCGSLEDTAYRLTVSQHINFSCPSQCEPLVRCAFYQPLGNMHVAELRCPSSWDALEAQVIWSILSHATLLILDREFDRPKRHTQVTFRKR